MIFLGKENFSPLPSKNKVDYDKKLVQSGKFSPATLFLEGSELNLSSSKKIVKWNHTANVLSAESTDECLRTKSKDN